MSPGGTDPVLRLFIGRDVDGGNIQPVERGLRDEQQRRRRQQDNADDIVHSMFLAFASLLRHELNVAIRRDDFKVEIDRHRPLSLAF